MRRTRQIIANLPHWQVLARASLVCALLGVLVFGLSLRKIEPLPLSQAPLQFNAAQAYEYTRILSKDFPNRTTWSDSRRRAGTWLKAELQKLGYQPKSLFFTETINGKEYTDLENIYAERPGTTHPEEIIVMSAHYDITDTTVEGAMDDGSGVGVVLELARVFAKENPERTLLFLLTDSEEFGAFWGARAFARDFSRADKIVAVANFDFVTAERQTEILTLCDGIQQGFTPLWLRELALNSIRSVGLVKAHDLTGAEEFVQRAMSLAASDHGPFLAAGIPAFNWVGQTDHFSRIMTHYHHTGKDVFEALQAASFESFGKSAERLVRSINALSKIPSQLRDNSYWKISQRMYLEGWGIFLLNVLAFLPFVIYSATRFGRVIAKQPQQKVMGVVINEAKHIGIVLGALLLGYVVMLLLPQLHVITQFELHPATQKAVLLNSPDFIAILLVVASVIGVYQVFRRVFRAPIDQEEAIEIRQALHAAFLSVIILLAFIKNPFLTSLLLLPPAYCWSAIRAKRGYQDRVMNVFLLLGGAITFVVMAIVLNLIFHVGVFYWYIFLAAAYGLISVYSVVLFMMAITVMFRLFRNHVL